jgi:hypothetical protein
MAKLNEGLDAFILFNEREEGVISIVEELDKRGVVTYLWRRDVPIGADFDRLENSRLDEAGCVLTFLGEHGWGPNHLKLAERARSMGKRMVPVLIGMPPEAEFYKAGGLFRELRYLDLREPNEQLITELVWVIRRREQTQPQTPSPITAALGQDSARFDRIVDLFVDGNDQQRADTLARVRVFPAAERPALAARLRHEITQNFQPGSEAQYALAIRDPKRAASVRSWMLSALIWLDAESPESRELILRHLQARHEDDRNIRFWVLAGLGQSRPSYLVEAISLSLSDDAPELSALARALANPADQAVAAQFREALASSDFQHVAWPVLRALRIVPIPDVAADVARLLSRDPGGEPWHYDAIYALSLPQMAEPAARVLSESPGVETVVTIVLRALRGSHFNATVAFAGFLSAFDRERVDRAIAALRSDVALGDVAARLRTALSTARAARGSLREFSVAGYASDTIDPRADRLDISKDVRTLTAVMLAEEVRPPLAIGLFGDWGSGKSFFMKSIQEAAKELADSTRKAHKTNFCTEIVQIEFNAWHYADTNLWASLVDYILEKLAAKVSPEQTPEQKQAEILADLGSTKGIVDQAQNEVDAIQKTMAAKQEDLETLRIDREKKQIELRDLEVRDFTELLEQENKEGLDTALKELGVPQAVSDVKELAQVVQETNTVRGQLAATLHSILNQKNPLLFWGLLGVALFGIPVLTWAINAALKTEIVSSATAAAAEIGALIVATSAALRKGLTKVKAHLAHVEAARQRIEKVLEHKRKQPTPAEVSLRAEIAGLSTKEQEAASRLSAATARVVELEEKIKALTEGRSLARFLAERRQSQDYQKHLGLISTIRKDFQSLEEKLTAMGKTGDPAHRVDRIILYIDDLDRCPSEKVLEVLQAVHLLLAFPLFVVVLGVDPRWLRHSLAKTYSALQSDLDDDEPERDDGKKRGIANGRWRDPRATPQNYLEKIFQIPFSLHPMTETGYGDLVEGLLVPSMPTQREAQLNAPAEPLPRTPAADAPRPSDSSGDRPADTGAPAAPSLSGDNPPKGPDDQAGSTPPVAVPSKGGTTRLPGATPSFIVSDEALHIRTWEGQFARRLFALIPTPRSAKRLSNVYRILKAGVQREDIYRFEGSEAFAGEFQLPMLLLAMIIKAPAECSLIFPLLLQRIEEGQRAIDSLYNLEASSLAADGDKATSHELGEAIRPIVSDEAFPGDNDAFARWIPQVSRFSFEIGGVLHPPEAERPAVRQPIPAALVADKLGATARVEAEPRPEQAT